MTDPLQDHEVERQRFIGLLNACGLAEAAAESLDAVALATEYELTAEDLEDELETLESFGLIDRGEGPGAAPVLRRAGRQYLDREGKVPRWQLHFLGRTVDDLVARAALLRA